MLGRAPRTTAFLYVLVLATACGWISAPARSASMRSPRAPSTQAGRLPDPHGNGELRILVPVNDYWQGTQYLPRDTTPPHLEAEMVRKFAREHRLRTVWIPVWSSGALARDLRQARGDLIATATPIATLHAERLAATVPVTVVGHRVVVRRDEGIAKPADLRGRTVAVRRGSPALPALGRLVEKYPGIRVHEVAASASASDLLDAVAAGTYDAAVAPSEVVETVTGYHPRLRSLLDVGPDVPLAWGVRRGSKKLLKSLNLFLDREGLARGLRKTYRDDLSGIEKRKVLRVLVRNNATSYFLWKGQLLGFEYELARRFAQAHDLYLEMVVPPTRKDLIPWLLAGRGDLIAASMIATKARIARGVAFSRPYENVSEVVVARAGAKQLTGPEDLEGHTVVVRRSSPCWPRLETLRRHLAHRGIHFNLEAAPEGLEDEQLVARVADGRYDLTVVTSNVADVELTWRNDIRKAFTLTGPRPVGWVVRAQDEKLLHAINAFFAKEDHSTFYNVTYDKYFRDPRLIFRRVSTRADGYRGGALCPYDDLVRKYARKYGLDWHLVVAQMYEESRFDPEAKSWTGAEGLMQILPGTAAQFGISDLQEPANGIRAGVRYLAWLKSQFGRDLSVQDRMWFALAAYNAGLGHVQDARRLAARLGLDPNHWFNNVERAMELLSRAKYAREAANGYVRGSEPVRYVRQIRNRYLAYLQLEHRAIAKPLQLHNAVALAAPRRGGLDPHRPTSAADAGSRPRERAAQAGAQAHRRVPHRRVQE